MAPPRLLDDATKRAERLRELIAKLEADEHVQNRDIGKVLTADEMDAFDRDMKSLRAMRLDDNTVLSYPHELDRYLTLVEQGTKEYTKGERLAGERRSHAYYRASVDLFQRAQEALEEIFDLAPPVTRSAIEFWLDRPMMRGEFGNIDIGTDPVSVPRKRGSRSRYAQSVGSVETKYDAIRRTKVGYLQMALDALTDGAPLAKTHSIDELRKLTLLVRR